LDHEEELDHSAVGEYDQRLAAIGPEAQRLRAAIHDEANRFRGHLWFEEFPVLS
jgi:uncharacterized small protein (DUF1192 family)